MAHQHDRRVIVYPNYINSKKTVAEGRRIPIDKACEHPNAKEIEDCVRHLKLECELEFKHYSRDWMVPGRLRVQLFNEDGTPADAEIPTRRALLLRIAELVPRHPGRHKKPGQKVEPSAAASAAGASSSASSSKQAAAASNKKKGKKK